MLEVDFKYKNQFIPSESTVENLKVSVCNYLNGDGLKDNVHIKKINDDIDKYCFQIIGYEYNGNKKVWCNLVPKDPENKWASEIRDELNENEIRIEVEYDISDNQCYKFSVK